MSISAEDTGDAVKSAFSVTGETGNNSEGGMKQMCAIMEDYAKEYAKESDRKAVFQLFSKGVGFEVVRISLTNLSE